MAVPVYLEIGSRRTFACAVDWPGWEREARDRDAALANLAGHRERYTAALALACLHGPPDDHLEVVETLEGNATTDFGAPGVVPEADRRTFDHVEPLVGFLTAGWAALDRAVAASSGDLAKGPRGGGRELDAIVAHVVDAETSYGRQIGVRSGRVEPTSRDEIARLRGALLTGMRAAADGSPKTRWPFRYFVRRVTWHALDHAWEIENRSI
jgi:hypothetical protein